MENWRDIKVVLNFNDIDQYTIVTLGEITKGCGDDLTIFEAYDILKSLQEKHNMSVQIDKAHRNKLKKVK